MATRMLIDARHPEETRVAVLKGNRIEEFDFESADRKQIKGNIYLAKVTRVEPSLQAAFVDFGGNRHGFLAFSEIHPDYYQIPKQDREALLAEEEAVLRAASEHEEETGEEADDDRYSGDDREGDGGVTEIDTSQRNQVATIEGGHVENGFEYSEDDHDHERDEAEDRADGDAEDGEDRAENDEGDENENQSRRRGRRRQTRGRSKEGDELRSRRMALRRRYKIQDVIQRRQVLLVQVVKEERGNKGAALTTYLSLAGRYCVLMPNSSHGGGISRKISAVADRKRLKSIIAELSLPRTMGCIVRTAGVSRTKTEIKRDFDYLARLWDEIRERTLSSAAPALIHSDSDLVKRAIRDIYNRDIEEVIVEGEEGHRAAKQFMKLLMPSHARRVKAYVDPVPLFQRFGAEDQLTAMYDPVVQLKSGGYIVINPTEALVSIDINSGRATKEHGIEATALNTNLEAAREIARQLRLRDMAGLVVIDFIDMEYGSNVRKVEKAMKDALKDDRARIQVGRISSFGLMEMSRQRLRTGVLEATTRICPHCDGTGLVRTASSASLSALRLIEDEAAKGIGRDITLYASSEASIYLLNSKRADLAEIELRYGVNIAVLPEGEEEGAKMRVTSSGPRPEFAPKFEPVIEEDDEDDELDEHFEEDAVDEDTVESDARPKRRKRRRGGRGRDRRDEQPEGETGEAVEADEAEDSESVPEETTADDSGEAPKKRRRRGGRRRRGRGRTEGAYETAEGETESAFAEDAAEDAEAGSFENQAPAEAEMDAVSDSDTVDEAGSPPETEAVTETEAESAPKPKRRSRRKKPEAAAETVGEAADAAETPEGAPVVEPAEDSAPAKPRRTRRKKADAPEQSDAPEQADGETSGEGPSGPVSEEAAPPKPKRARRKAVKPVEEPVEQQAEEPEPAPEEREAAPRAEPAPMTQTVAQENEAMVPFVARTEADGDDDADADENGRRRGWWQRTFGP